MEALVFSFWNFWHVKHQRINTKNMQDKNTRAGWPEAGKLKLSNGDGRKRNGIRRSKDNTMWREFDANMLS